MGLIYFVLLLGGLVFFHEFGHFIVARLCGVRVLTFSLGFGPGWTVYKSPRSGTEYCLAILPLGGYVRMLGEDPTMEISDEDYADSFGSKALWKRTLIVAAGPVFNLILPIFIFFFMGIFATELAPSELGMVMTNGPAWEAGLREGDRVLSIDDDEVDYWWQLHAKISGAADQDVSIRVKRGNREIETMIRPRLYSELRIPQLGFMDQKGQIRVGAEFVKPVVVPVPESSAAKAGLQEWDQIVAINGQKIDRFAAVQHYFEQTAGTLELDVVRKEQWFQEDAREPVSLDGLTTSRVVLQSAGTEGSLAGHGIRSAELVVAEVEEGSPASALKTCPSSCETEEDCAVGSVCMPGANGEAGACQMLCERESDCVESCVSGRCTTQKAAAPTEGFSLSPGDEILAHNGVLLQRWHHMRSKLNEYPARPHRLDIRRADGEELIVCFVPETATIKNEFNSEEKRIFLGVSNRSALDLPPRIPNESRFVYASHRAIWDTVDAIRVNLYAIGGLFVGSVPMSQLGGPIFIGQLAAKTQERGFRWFFGIMVMLSINLGLLNLLPIPMLDGGHLFFFAIEAVTRRPVSIRVRQIAAYIGLSFIFLLMIMVFKNDLERVLGGM